MQCSINQQNQQNQQKVRAQAENQLAPKQMPRAPQLLPQGAAPIRPASSVSTQTAQSQNPNSMLVSKGGKMRTKQPSVRPAGPAIKTEGTQQKMGQHQQLQQVVTSVGNK